MRLASLCTQLVGVVERNVSRMVERAVSEEKSKLYVNVLSDVKAFIKNVREFASTLKGLEELLPELKCGRICFRWLYAEEKGAIALIRLEPSFSLLYTGDYIRITYSDRTVVLYPTTKIGFAVNQYSDTVDLDDENAVVLKRSLLLDAIGKINQQLEKAIESISLCIKQLRRKIG